MMRTLTAVLCVFLSSGIAYAEGASVDAAACERLAASLKLPRTTVTSAQAVPAGAFVPPGPGGAAAAKAAAGLPAFCRVRLTLKPSADSDIKSEVWLPLSGWNGKFQQVGNGAWGGSIQYGPLGDGLRRGYAVASTDTGHGGSDASFAVGHPEKLIDFGYRAVHETAMQGKATVVAGYGTGPRVSYFEGCSGGGRQAFMEAQRFPLDFDAIIAGDPGYNRMAQSFQLVSIAQATLTDPASFIAPAKYPVIHQAALNACDALDGLKDGLISDPPRCHFDPAVLLCKGGDDPNCLTQPQVQAAKKIYAPLKDPRTGEEVFPGLEPGSEPRWAVSVGGPRPLGMSDDLFKSIVIKDVNWDFKTLDVSKHLDLARTIDNGTISPTSPNLAAFLGRGGKLLMYHGWGDPNISPRSSTHYYERLVSTLGKSRVEGSVRLYMVPGMGHCGGGEGPNTFDMMSVLDEWREHGKAPAEVVASHLTEGKVDRTRPLCPYPQMARYKGTGSINEAANFVCR